MGDPPITACEVSCRVRANRCPAAVRGSARRGFTPRRACASGSGSSAPVLGGSESGARRTGLGGPEPRARPGRPERADHARCRLRTRPAERKDFGRFAPAWRRHAGARPRRVSGRPRSVLVQSRSSVGGVQSRTSRATGRRASTTSAAMPATSETNRSPVSRSRHGAVGQLQRGVAPAVPRQPDRQPGRDGDDAPAVERHHVLGRRPGDLDRLVPGEPLRVVPAGPQHPGDDQQLRRPGLVDRRHLAAVERRRAASGAARSRPAGGCPGRPARSPTARCPGRRPGRRASSAAAASATASSTSRTARSGSTNSSISAVVAASSNAASTSACSCPSNSSSGVGPRRRGAGLAGGLLDVGVRPLARQRPRADEVLPHQVGQRPVGQRVPVPAASGPAAPTPSASRPARPGGPGRPRCAWCRASTASSSTRGSAPRGAAAPRGTPRPCCRSGPGRRRPR